MSSEVFVHNLRLCREFTNTKYEFEYPLRMESSFKWHRIIALPRHVLESEFWEKFKPLAHVLGGWPLLVAFANDDDAALAKMLF